MNTIFWAAMKLLLLSFLVLFCFLIPRTLNPIFVLAKIIFLPWKNILPSLPPPPPPHIPLPLHLQYSSLHGLEQSLLDYV